MARYLLKRIWGPASESAMLENALRSKRVRNNTFLDITWDHSHVVADEDGLVISYCLYEAPSVERVLAHASMTGGHFVDHVLPLAADVAGAGEATRAGDAVDAPAGGVPARYLLVQRWPRGATATQIEADLRATDAEAAEVVWEHSHLSADDRGRPLSHGVYRADNEGLVRRQAKVMAGSELVELYEIGGDVRPEDLAD